MSNAAPRFVTPIRGSLKIMMVIVMIIVTFVSTPRQNAKCKLSYRGASDRMVARINSLKLHDTVKFSV